MDATSAPDVEETSLQSTSRESAPTSQAPDLAGRPIKSEENGDLDADDTINAIGATSASNNDDDDGSATVRPAPQPSAKRKESEALLSTPEPGDKRPNKKPKRGKSPPWDFGEAKIATLKTADGRRISARVNTATPQAIEPVSETEGRGRSDSQPTSARSRQPSPPWKRFEAEGPTTVVVDGKRKSGRVIRELGDAPKRVSPRTKKQVDKLGTPQNVEKKPVAGKTMGASSKKAEPDGKKPANGYGHNLDRPSTSTASAKKIAELKAQIAALQPTRSFPVSETKPTAAHKRNASKDAMQIDPPTSPPINRKMHRMNNAATSSPKTPLRPSPRIKLKFNPARHYIPPPHPQAKPPTPPRPPQLSIYQVIEQYELQEMQQPYMETDKGPPNAEYFAQKAAKQAAEEGQMRRRLLMEAQPGGILSRQHCSIYQEESQTEPAQQYGHYDHVVAHALWLRQLQLREKAQHRTQAKKIAYEALEKWKERHGPTEEDIVAEENKRFDLIKRQVIADMKAKWEMVEAYVQDAKKRAWEVEQERIRAEKLQKKLEYSENLLAKQRGEQDSDIDMDEDSTGDVGESDAEEQEDEGEENMSDSESEAEQDDAEEGGEMDEDALAAYLAQREAEPPDKTSDDGGDGEDGEADEDEEMGDVGLSAMLGDGTANHEIDEDAEKDDALDESATRARANRRSQAAGSASPSREEAAVEEHLSSDESTDMDSDDYDSDEAMSSTDDEAGHGDDDNNDAGSEDGSGGASMLKTSLLGFYSAKELRDQAGGLPTPMTSVEGGGEDTENARSGSEAISIEKADVDMSIDKIETAEHSAEGSIMDPEPELINSEPQTVSNDVDVKEDHDDDVEDMETVEDQTTKNLVPIPSLLRGTLRTYQHAGLDWLASLYRNGTNGILADEMGLGKTIQTISVLAHLAEVHEVWEAHLVIVPTSVILNWVTEFQKFLPGFRVLGYYGTAEERQQKRKGWTNDPHHENKEKRGYNVVITSYNVAMQDINAIRNVQWHYLILDEAHNIRNFNSQRWQVLIRLRTRARLLLTGTPLQNDLAEVWSLLTFLTAGDDDRSHGELEEFLGHWKDPVKEIFDQGVQKISENAQRVVDQLHISLRPFLLRRKKSEVEKDLPKKTESVVVCKLSKRQRQLYQDYMGLAETKATLAKGSGVQAGAVLLSLRRVCNHPDLFDPRPIQTSFAMEFSPLETYNPRERLVRQLLGTKEDFSNGLLLIGRESQKRAAVQRSKRLSASSLLQRQIDDILANSMDESPDPATLAGARALQRLRQRDQTLQQIRACIRATDSAISAAPVYGADLRELVTVQREGSYLFSPRTLPPPHYRYLQGRMKVGHRPLRFEHPVDWHLAASTRLQQDVATHISYAERLQDTIVRFAFVPPAVTVPILDFAIPAVVQDVLRVSPAYPTDGDWGHEARIRTSIAFPDRRLLVYDSGKLQRLVYLLRELQAKGSRSLIFTQMTGTLNVLEQFLNLLNLPYLRLDGSTPVERRQLYSAEFNRPDSKYQCMILSSRAGGVGLNLTGASSVIFYDLDWNPQMDRQCMDRAHRIGQVRDVEVYKMVSEKTVEENILRRANQKSLLDQTIIQEGHFTTEYTRKRDDDEEGDDEVGAAIDKFLGGEERTNTKALESVEDREDVQAAQQAAKEDRQDDVDFAERSSKGPSKANTPGPGLTEEDNLDDEELQGHVDKYMIKYMENMLKDWVYVPPPVRKLDKHGRDPSHRPKRKR
ncbi:Helicase swr1 [Fulvia fulva]|uniref:DNA helicase n=1 Tax=Passalora fulva TaxID=5499 RepID=A0A9Q8P7X7_PASFU|nr:Helicase swr1 [Fulvia fulva]KAK4627121.1 Helicase swr1 [Fulvia fulva]KAK4628345.1 Helicase swr1 [Fulvia fulva]UJO16501.1 Helicase swr1 [Fulvia fulva]WPV13435.1 Helicase swr1 [Fulvia fulva]WPV28509.1 Helicase swr1 [Fulvia fulva]